MIDRLPQDVLLHIITFMENPGHLRLVCRLVISQRTIARLRLLSRDTKLPDTCMINQCDCFPMGRVMLMFGFRGYVRIVPYCKYHFDSPILQNVVFFTNSNDRYEFMI